MVIVTRLITGEYASADAIPAFAGAAPAAALALPARAEIGPFEAEVAEVEMAVPDADMSTKLSALFVKFDGSSGPGTLSSAKVCPPDSVLCSPWPPYTAHTARHTSPTRPGHTSSTRPGRGWLTLLRARRLASGCRL